MKKLIILSQFLLECFFLTAQQKGATPIVNGQQSIAKNTYAVVVGISNYQDKDIPDLRFADKDAEAFANFLRSEAGGKLDVNHLKVLINSEATMAQFAIALDWLWEVCKENDRAIIYFSGHGDVEKKSITQPGYLLCWDAPAHVYMSGGAFALPMFQDVITTLSTQNKAKVIIITDACRSGKLSGTSVGGTQITGSNLAKQYANEIKILSCQPNEFSIEGNQWGGGRGAFSYHLLQVLYGMADLDSDHQVTLKEIGKYLDERVSEEVSPLQQNPMVVGSVTEKIANVIPEILSTVKDGNLYRIKLFSSIDSRGIADEVLANVDSNIVNLYLAFNRALKNKQYLFAENGSDLNDYADYYYKKLIAEPKLERLYNAITRNYAASLQDDAQQTINEWLKTSQNSTLNLNKIESKSRLTNKLWTKKVRLFPRCLERAAELLGSRHYMYKVIMARSKFFEGYLLANSSNNPDAEMGYRAFSFLRQSLDWLPDQPHVYWQMSQVYASLIPRPDSLEYYTRKALELIPNWTFACCDAAFNISNKFKMFDRAESYLNQASMLDSASLLLKNAWGSIYSITHRYREAEMIFNKVVQYDSTYLYAFYNLGIMYSEVHNFEKAEAAFKKVIQLDSTLALPWNNLGKVFADTRRFDSAETVFKKAIQLDSTTFIAWYNLGIMYSEVRNYKKAEATFKKAIQLDSSHALAWNNLGKVFADTRQFEKAETTFEKAIQLDSSIALTWNNLGKVYIDIRQFEKAEATLKKAIQVDSTLSISWNNLSNVYYDTRRLSEAENALRNATKFDSTFGLAWYNLACVQSLQKVPEQAFNNLEQAIKNGYKEFDWIQKDDDLALLRENKVKWNMLMQRYFPEKVNGK